MRRITGASLALILLIAGKLSSQPHSNLMPSIVEKNGRHALLVDGKPFLIMGGQVHNSSGWPGMLPKVWLAAEQLHVNTLEVPIYWEQIEPSANQYNFSLIDTLLTQARSHHVRLVLLWFATWKNGSNHYMPGWMKRAADTYPDITGKKGEAIDSPSPHIQATLAADKRAFVAVMKHLKLFDEQHTVIMVQVENESGAWGSVRDYSPLAQKLFESAVPNDLLQPSVLQALHTPLTKGGSWKAVFGERADEYFHAWAVAKYIGEVAAAGKAVYKLPLYVNAALRDPLTNPMANSYESGGPTDNVIPIWKVEAPAIDILAPDIYLSGSERVLKVLELYSRADNPLFVPEAGLIPENAKYFYATLNYGGIGFSPFGIDDNGSGETPAETEQRLAPFAGQYKVAAPMANELAAWTFEGKVTAAVEHDDHADQLINLGAWQAIISFGTGPGGGKKVVNPLSNGSVTIVKLEENKFLVIGSRSHITFKPNGADGNRAWQYVKVEEGQYENGTFKSLRILNGDETDWGGPRFGDTPVVVEISLVLR